MKGRAGILTLLVLLTACGSSSANSASSLGNSASSSANSASSSASSAVSGTTSTSSAGGGASCGPAAAKTLTGDGRVRVYSVGNVVYGCSAGRSRSFRLGHATRSIAESEVNPIAVAGEIAAYGLRNFGVDTVEASVVVRRLTDGTQLKEFSATRAAAAESFRSVDSLVVKSDGAVAWIGSVTSIIGHRSVTEVHEAQSTQDRVLDTGTAIDATSLRLHGSTLTWVDRGVTRHASLP